MIEFSSCKYRPPPKEGQCRLGKIVVVEPSAKHGELVAEALLLDKTYMAVGEEKIARLRRDLNRVRLEFASHCAGVGVRPRQ